MQNRNKEIIKLLEEHYADAKPALVFSNPYELLVATILSAQCTDVRVNKVTEQLFKHYPTADALSKADYYELSEEVRTCGCYKIKAKNLIGTAKMLCEEYGGNVPQDMDALLGMPGVGRKTASVVLSNAFGIPAFAVDTHVFRVSNRLGIADAADVLETEKQVCAQVPKEKWGNAHHWLIWHGRKICTARSPKCADCFLNGLCKYANKQCGEIDDSR